MILEIKMIKQGEVLITLFKPIQVRNLTVSSMEEESQ
jgi:hypothetical protein